jgi:serine/threonine protein kinase
MSHPQSVGLADSDHPTNHGQRSLALPKLLRLFTDVCNAIDFAHSRSVLDRDIQPGNIIVGKYGETLVVDWGLAKPPGYHRPGARGGLPQGDDARARRPVCHVPDDGGRH